MLICTVTTVDPQLSAVEGHLGMSDEDSDVPTPESTLKCLILTDTHCGYLGQDLVRGDDSLNTLEEMLKLARDREVRSECQREKKRRERKEEGNWGQIDGSTRENCEKRVLC